MTTAVSADRRWGREKGSTQPERPPTPAQPSMLRGCHGTVIVHQPGSGPQCCPSPHFLPLHWKHSKQKNRDPYNKGHVYHPCYDMRTTLYSAVFPKTTVPVSLIVTKTSDKSRQRHLTKHLTTNCQGHQKRGKSDKPSQPRGAEGDMTTKCYVGSWMGSWGH